MELFDASKIYICPFSPSRQRAIYDDFILSLMQPEVVAAFETGAPVGTYQAAYGGGNFNSLVQIAWPIEVRASLWTRPCDPVACTTTQRG